ncbi:hypothetical protein DL93DRAFT_2229639 [Clavulina sp. PMI_390]|nr:hypothetical protein DL93DRAFT_2229639 [Clavulina sp. PMI_390]
MEVVKDTQLSATQRLPDELILDVFNHLRKRRNWTELARLQSMVTVSQVCSRWRGIAIAASALWSELVISPSDTQSIESSKRARDRIEECLFRSRTVRNLTLTSSEDHATASVIFPLRGDLSSMESLGIGIEDGIDEEDDRALEKPVMIRSFSDAIFSPSRFRITTRLPATIPGFDGSRLEALYIADEDIGYSTILKLLQSSMNVQRMHLELLDPGALVHESLDFPHLAFLSVIYDWPSRNFQLPALQKLFFIEPFLLNQSHTWANLQADFPKLRHLTFVNVVDHFGVLEVEEIFSVLRHLPKLVTLELKHWSMHWLLHFAIAGPLTPRAVDTEWLVSHDPFTLHAYPSSW